MCRQNLTIAWAAAACAAGTGGSCAACARPVASGASPWCSVVWADAHQHPDAPGLGPTVFLWCFLCCNNQGGCCKRNRDKRWGGWDGGKLLEWDWRVSILNEMLHKLLNTPVLWLREWGALKHCHDQLFLLWLGLGRAPAGELDIDRLIPYCLGQYCAHLRA